jgi:hypothetical protein
MIIFGEEGGRGEYNAKTNATAGSGKRTTSAGRRCTLALIVCELPVRQQHKEASLGGLFATTRKLEWRNYSFGESLFETTPGSNKQTKQNKTKQNKTKQNHENQTSKF